MFLTDAVTHNESKFKPHQLQLWGCWVWLRGGQQGVTEDISSRLSSLLKTTQMLYPKHIQQATNAGSHTTVTRADEHEPIQLCPRLCPPASFLFAGHYGRCQSNWSFISSSPWTPSAGGDVIRLSLGASVLRQSGYFAVGLLAAEHWQSWLPTPNIKCHFNSQPLGKPRPLEQWTHAKQLL